MCQDSRIRAGVVVSCAGHSIACSFIPARRPPPISHRPGYLDLIILPFASSSTKTTSCLQTSTPPLPLRQTFQRIMLPSRLRRLHHPSQPILKQDLAIPGVSQPLHCPSFSAPIPTSHYPASHPRASSEPLGLLQAVWPRQSIRQARYAFFLLLQSGRVLIRALRFQHHCHYQFGKPCKRTFH